MKRTTLKSSQFRKEREASWRELDALVARMESGPASRWNRPS